jgi:hypothetical protein
MARAKPISALRPSGSPLKILWRPEVFFILKTNSLLILKRYFPQNTLQVGKVNTHKSLDLVK